MQTPTDELKRIAEKIISEQQKVVDDYKGGKTTALMSLVGMMMKAIYFVQFAI